MTAPHEPCSDGTRRAAFRLMRDHGLASHHDILPWCGISSLSRASGVTEGQVLMLLDWVRRDRPTTEYWHAAPDQHRLTTYLPCGDVEFACLTDEEYRMATTPRPSGRVRLGPPAAPAVAPAPAPVPPSVVPAPTPAPARSGRVVLRRPEPAPVVAAPVEVAATPEPIVVIDVAPSLPDLTGHGYVCPNPSMGVGLGWRPPEPPRPTRVGLRGRVRRAYRGHDDGPEPHGPPCPLERHPLGRHAWWHVPEVRA